MNQIVVTSLVFSITTCVFYLLVYPAAEEIGKILLADKQNNTGEEILKKALETPKAKHFYFRYHTKWNKNENIIRNDYKNIEVYINSPADKS